MFRSRFCQLAGILLLALNTGCPDPAATEPPGCAAACPEGLVCDASTGTCVPPADAGTSGCATDAQCSGGTPYCNSGTCVQCLAPSACESGICWMNQCLPVPEKCDVAHPLTVGESPLVIEATTAGRVGDAAPSCAIGDAAPDLVYAVTVVSPSRLSAKATPKEGSGFRPVLELRTSCGSASAEHVLDCRWSDAEDAVTSLSVDVAAGTYFLWVDADFGTSGAFTLELTASPAVPGDSCVAPRKILATTDTISLEGDTRALKDDYRGNCGGAGSPDEVIELVIDKPRRLQVEVKPVSPGFLPAVYLRRPDGCASNVVTAQLECSAASSGGQAVLDLPNLQPGSYFLIVDGAVDSTFEPTSGAWQATVKQLAAIPLATNDTCAGAQPVVLPPSGSVSVTGDTFSALSDSSSPCGGAGADLVYTFTLTEPRYVAIRATPDSSPMFAPVVSLRSDCDSPELIACNAATQYGGAATVLQGNLPAGTWFVWVDGAGQSRGKFSLNFDVAPPLAPPANDTCQAPQKLVPTLGTATAMGTTLSATDDATECEFPPGVPSNDVVYELDIPTQSSLSLDVQATSGSPLQPVLYVDRAGTCGAPAAGERLFCSWPDLQTPGRVVRTLGSVSPGKYFIWVDGDLTSSGAFQLKASLGPSVPPPVNDSCGSAILLPGPGTLITGDTRSADDSTWGACLPYLTGSGEGAGDVAFTFTLSAPKTVTLTATPDPLDGKLFRPALYVRGPHPDACEVDNTNQQVGCAVAPALGSAATLSLNNLPAGTWSVWVDGVGQTTGKFTFSIQ